MLESRLARWKGTEDAVVFGSGYLANIGIVTALAGARDLICIDALAHSCLLSAAQLSRAKTVEFPHNDASALADLLQTHRRGARHCLVLTEGVFSMDGDRAPLDALSDICEQHDAWLLCDDAHGVGVLGDGRGTAHSFAPVPQVDLQMGTLSKGLGAYGGYVAASTQVCRYLRSRARSFVYSTAPPAGPLAAAATAIDIIEQEPDRTRRPLELARRFTADLGLPPAASAIVPLLVGASETALALARQLRLAGIYAPAIRPPTVPQGTARIRLAFSAAHSDADVQQLQQALRVAGYSA